MMSELVVGSAWICPPVEGWLSVPPRFRPVLAPEPRPPALLLAVFAWPVRTVGFVGAYGFAVWMSQQVYGPPSYGSGGHGH